MNNIDLWSIYQLSTNAKNDVWTLADFQNQKIKQKKKIGQPKRRPTFAIQKLRTLNSGEEIYLICQVNTSFNKEALGIPNSLTKCKPPIHGNVLPINIRLASSNEFAASKTPHLYVNPKERPMFYKAVWNKINNHPWLKTRLQQINKLLNGEYDHYNQKQVSNLVKKSQFNNHELTNKDSATNKNPLSNKVSF